MKRREFFVRIGGVLVAIPSVLAVTACGGGDDDDDDSADAAGATSFSGGTSTSDGSGHTHNFTVQCADLGGNSATYSATGSGHEHSITLDASQLTALGNGDLVSFDTNDSHAHSWEVRKPSTAC
jgi:hypothetical protein